MKLRIRSKIFLGYLLLLFILFPIQAVSFWSTNNYIKKDVDLNLAERAENAAFLVENFLSNTEVDILGVAQTYKEDHTLGYTDTLKLINTTFGQNSFINKISVLSLTGRELIKAERFKVAKDDELSYEIPTTAFDNAVKGQTGISKVYYMESNSSPQLDMYGPVISDKGAVIAVVKVRLQLAEMWNTVAQVKLGENGFAYVVDDEGRLIAHPKSSLVLQGVNFGSRPVIKNQTANNSKGTFTYLNEKDVKVIAAGKRIQQVGWVAVAEEPYSEAFAQAILLRNLFIGTVLMSLVIYMAISLVLSNQFTRPIIQLINFTNAIREGKLNSQVYVKSGDEIEELAVAFNNMGNQLHAAFTNLNDAKEAAEGERNKLQIIISGIKDGVIAVDLQRKILLFNPAAEQITGIKATDVVGKDVSTIFKVYEDNNLIPVDKYCPPVTSNFEGIVYTHNNLKLETGTKSLYANLIVGQIKEGVRINLGSLITFHDVSAEQELEKMKIDFVSMAAHELRTPLTSVQGYLSFLQEPVTKDKLSDKEREFLTRASLSAVKLNQLIENILVVAKIEKGTVVIRPVAMQIEPVIAKVLEEFSQFANNKGLTLHFIQPENRLPEVLADPLRIEEVIVNLIDNAINYTAKGSVTVTTELQNHSVVIAVKDTGQGIPEEAIPHLFTKFFRIKGELQSGSKGTGLGLYISKNIVQAHKGEIWVESKVNEGSIFYLKLPLAS